MDSCGGIKNIVEGTLTVIRVTDLFSDMTRFAYKRAFFGCKMQIIKTMCSMCLLKAWKFVYNHIKCVQEVKKHDI